MFLKSEDRLKVYSNIARGLSGNPEPQNLISKNYKVLNAKITPLKG